MPRYGRGEGFAVAVLALPSADVSGGAHAPAAVIAASAVNQDGRSSGLTAPNGPAQTRLVAGATAASGYEPSDTKLVRRGSSDVAL
jgi:acyl transferase domain-containing protein